MSESLYTISATYKQLQELAETCDPSELGTALDEAFALLDDDLTSKLDNCASIIGRWQGIIEAQVSEIKRMQERKTRFEARISALKERMMSALDIAGKRKIEGNRYTVSKRKGSERCIIDDESKVPTMFRIAQPDKIDKAGIKKALADGQVEGAHIERGPDSISIK